MIARLLRSWLRLNHRRVDHLNCDEFRQDRTQDHM